MSFEVQVLLTVGLQLTTLWTHTIQYPTMYMYMFASLHM